MAGNSQRRGATTKGKGNTAGSGGRVRRGLEGKGPRRPDCLRACGVLLGRLVVDDGVGQVLHLRVGRAVLVDVELVLLVALLVGLQTIE